MESSIAGIADLLGKLANAPQADTATDDAPAKSTPQDKVKQTTARADTIKRTLDHETVETDGNGVEIVADGKTGLYRQGARVKMLRSGKTQVGSLSRSEVAFVRDNADEIMAALDTVEKRAKIGSHLPKVAAS